MLYHFTIDTTPPAVPGVNPITTPTNNATQIISGSKDANANLILNGTEVVEFTQDIIWQYTANLEEGQNQFVFSSRDQAGNQSGW